MRSKHVAILMHCLASYFEAPNYGYSGYVNSHQLRSANTELWVVTRNHLFGLVHHYCHTWVYERRLWVPCSSVPSFKRLTSPRVSETCLNSSVEDYCFDMFWLWANHTSFRWSPLKSRNIMNSFCLSPPFSWSNFHSDCQIMSSPNCVLVEHFNP